MPRLILLSLLALACRREPVEVVCVYPDEDQDQETATQDTSDTGEGTPGEPEAIVWDGIAEFPCDTLLANEGEFLDADAMALVARFSLTVDTGDLPAMANPEYYGVIDGALVWQHGCSSEAVFTLMLDTRD